MSDRMRLLFIISKILCRSVVVVVHKTTTTDEASSHIIHSHIMLYNAAVVFTIVIAFTFMDLFQACSNIIVSPGASSDQSSIVAYNADSVTLYGSLYHYPAAIHNPDEVNIGIF